jgi:hypothetical protein
MNKVNKWINNECDMVWWEVHEKSITSLTKGQQRVIHKYIHNKLPCYYRQNMYYEEKSSKCRMCGKTETQEHILTCKKCIDRKKLRKEYVLDLSNIMDKHGTNSNIKLVMIQNVSNQLHKQEVVELNEYVPDASNTLKKAIKQQQMIGWNNWLKGRWSSEWETLQNYENHQSLREPRKSRAEMRAKEI